MNKILTVMMVFVLTGICYAQESNPYHDAVSLLVNIPNGFLETSYDLLKKDWREDEVILKIVSDNKSAIEAFKKATMTESDGFILWKKEEKGSATLDTPEYSGEFTLFSLVLLEGKIYESKGILTEAGSDYLAAMRFMRHLSEQKNGILISTLFNYIAMDYCQLYLNQSILAGSYSRDFYKSGVDSLVVIKNNQDFLESAFKEEGETIKDLCRSLEESVKNGGSFESLFKISGDIEIFRKNEKDLRNIKKLEPMFIQGFFTEFYKQIDGQVDEFISAAIVAAKENNTLIYEKKNRDFIKSIDRFKNPLHYVSWVFVQLVIKKRPHNIILADKVARMIMSVVLPDFSLTIKRYYLFDGKLNDLIDKFKEKAEHAALPI